MDLARRHDSLKNTSVQVRLSKEDRYDMKDGWTILKSGTLIMFFAHHCQKTVRTLKKTSKAGGLTAPSVCIKSFVKFILVFSKVKELCSAKLQIHVLQLPVDTYSISASIMRFSDTLNHLLSNTASGSLTRRFQASSRTRFRQYTTMESFIIFEATATCKEKFTVWATSLGFETSGHTSTDDLFCIRTDFIAWIIGVVIFSDFGTVEGGLFEVFREKRKDTCVQQRQKREPLKRSTKRERSWAGLPRYPTNLCFYSSYLIPSSLHSLLSSTPNV